MNEQQLAELKRQFSRFWEAQAGRITGEWGSINLAHQIYNTHKVRSLIASQCEFFNHPPTPVKSWWPLRLWTWTLNILKVSNDYEQR